jgi:hypothetical protein
MRTEQGFLQGISDLRIQRQKVKVCYFKDALLLGAFGLPGALPMSFGQEKGGSNQRNRYLNSPGTAMKDSCHQGYLIK